MEKIDLHIHSNFSDGDKTISQLITNLKEENFELFSITDHAIIIAISNLQYHIAIIAFL